MMITTQKGYTLLFAIIVSSIVLAVAAFILSISRKQFILASAARDSTVAIYQADGGIECMIEEYGSVTRSGTGNFATTSPGNSYTFTCGTQSLSFTFIPFYSMSSSDISEAKQLGYYTNSTLAEAILPPIVLNGGCALVTVYDGVDSSNNTHMTTFDSRGYNIGSASACPQPGPREEERALQIKYHD